MVINVQAVGVDMTDALHGYATQKVEGLTKYFENIQQVDVTIAMPSQHHNKGKVYVAEMEVHVPGKNLFIKKEAEDMYKAIDKVRDHLKVEFEKLKGKMRSKDRKNVRESKAYQVEE